MFDIHAAAMAVKAACEESQALTVTVAVAEPVVIPPVDKSQSRVGKRERKRLRNAARKVVSRKSALARKLDTLDPVVGSGALVAAGVHQIGDRVAVYSNGEVQCRGIVATIADDGRTIGVRQEGHKLVVNVPTAAVGVSRGKSRD